MRSPASASLRRPAASSLPRRPAMVAWIVLQIRRHHGQGIGTGQGSMPRRAVYVAHTAPSLRADQACSEQAAQAAGAMDHSPGDAGLHSLGRDGLLLEAVLLDDIPATPAPSAHSKPVAHTHKGWPCGRCTDATLNAVNRIVLHPCIAPGMQPFYTCGHACELPASAASVLGRPPCSTLAWCSRIAWWLCILRRASSPAMPPVMTSAASRCSLAHTGLRGPAWVSVPLHRVSCRYCTCRRSSCPRIDAWARQGDQADRQCTWALEGDR